MSATTTIEWCDHTFNPWIGCTKVSPACDHCYAEAMARRYGWATWGPGEPRSRTTPGSWRKPIGWHNMAARTGVRRRVFCASLADVFDAEVPDEWRLELMQLINGTHALDWLLLTKRPQVAKKFFLDRRLPDNVWLGTTVEDQAMAELRIPLLLSIPAKVRFLSCEPLLGPIDLTRIQYCRQGFERWTVNALTGALSSDFNNQATPLPSLGWVIAGGESGPKARPSHPDWFRSLRDQCADAGVPFFFKQWGSWYPEIDRDFHDPDWRADYGVADGKRFRIMNLAGGRGFHGERVHLMARKSKASAGAMLDGREHREFPL